MLRKRSLKTKEQSQKNGVSEKGYLWGGRFT